MFNDCKREHSAEYLQIPSLLAEDPLVRPFAEHPLYKRPSYAVT